MLGPAFEVRDLSSYPQMPQIVESGETFAENAKLKAMMVSKRVTGLVLGDDSGLEVDLLDGAPGLFSARYAGPGATDEANRQKLLRELHLKIADRADTTANNKKRFSKLSPARFRCALAIACDGKLLKVFTAACEGEVIDTTLGQLGFGYDPLFVPAGYDKTFAELSPTTKNRISHRGKAAHEVFSWLTGSANQSAE